MVQTCLKKTDLRSKLCSYLETTENVGPGAGLAGMVAAGGGH